jgi:hypothetical protein
MGFGIGSGKLHTGRRVQLVIWLQIMQEWVGIAGVTVYVSESKSENSRDRHADLRPTGSYHLPDCWICQ